MSFQSPVFEPVQYSIECFPARKADGTIQNLSLKQLKDPNFLSLLRATLSDEECTYFAPTVNAMSGIVLSHKPFTDICELDRHRIKMCRPGYIGNADARIPCDGTFIERMEGFIMAAGGCPLVVLSGRGEHGRCICIVAHAGRDCLIDPLMVRKGQPSRAHESVIDAMVAYAKKYFGAEPEDLILRSFYSLPWQAFPHDQNDPEHRDVNKKLHEYLKQRGLDRAIFEQENVQYLSLNEIIRLQANKLGIGQIQAGLLDLPINGDYAYTRHALPELGGTMRNLVVMRRL